ncbi:MAG: PilZ domain-containing protein, partial [Candidatus Omnitrophica bacterium]|nr:PilZ domain-containing protein [Candidatus Omnitrophota bacterium]
ELMKTAGANKRSEARQGCYVPVESKEGSAFDDTQTVDISSHGIGFVSSHSHEINEKVAIEIQLKPNTEPVLVLGVVKWVRKLSDSDQYRIGLNFEEVLSGPPSRLKSYFRKA